VVDRPLSEPRPGWVRLAITATGICGTDLNLLYAAPGSAKGVQPGHEVAGIIDLVGDSVTLPVGTPVALEPVIGCATCRFCRRGLPNLCSNLRLCGFTRPGGLADYVLVPEDALYPVRPSLPASITALTEPMAVCVRALSHARLRPGERVAIIGAGSIGLLSILAARAAGATEIISVARHPHQQALARALGAHHLFSESAELLKAVGPQHVDVVVETVGGRGDTLRESATLARSGGRIVLVGVFDRETAFPGMLFFQKELSLHASNCYARECHRSDFTVATELVDRYRDELAPLVTHRFALDQVVEAFATAADKTRQSIKVQVHP
jgi:threonine dehydrogenase-like Zn-dependent dehydrogenase